MTIKSFSQFLAESDSSLADDAKVSSLVQEIDRCYGMYPDVSTSSVQIQEINFLEEKRDWPDFAETAKLASNQTAHCKMYLKFEKVSDIFEMQFDFDVTYQGVENFDKPDFNPRSPEQTDRMGISLEALALKKIQVKSSDINYSSGSFSKALGKTVLRFLLNVMKPLFDKIGDEALIIRQL
jgi:hypothetical protein